MISGCAGSPRPVVGMGTSRRFAPRLCLEPLALINAFLLRFGFAGMKNVNRGLTLKGMPRGAASARSTADGPGHFSNLRVQNNIN